MLTLRLFCAAGMSTSLLERRIKDAAKEQGIELDVAAYPVNEMDYNLDGIDVALLGPQVHYLLPQAKAKCGARGIPVAVIPMRDYGMVNGKNVLNFALELLGK
jgi:PTS system cellobiose-specific IIB component